MPAAAQLGADGAGVHPGTGADGDLDGAGPKLPEGDAAVGALHQGGQGAELLNVGLGSVHLLPQGQGDLHDDHPLLVVEFHIRHHPALHGQTSPAFGAEQRLVHRGHVRLFQKGGGNAVGAGGGVGIDEAAGVGGDGHVQRQSDGGGDGGQSVDDPVDDLTGGGSRGVHAGVPGEAAVGGVVVDGQFNAVGVSFRVFRQQAGGGHVHADDVLRCKAVRPPVGGGVGGVGGGDLRVVKEMGRLAQIPQGLA